MKPVSPKKTRVTLHDGRQRHLEASDDSKRGNQVVAIHSTKYELHVRMPCIEDKPFFEALLHSFKAQT